MTLVTKCCNLELSTHVVQIIPAKMVHFFFILGKFNTVNMMADTLYSDRLKGRNQSMFSIRPRPLKELTLQKSLHTLNLVLLGSGKSKKMCSI